VKAEGRKLGRPSALTAESQAEVKAARLAGVSLGALAKKYGVSRSAIQRLDKAG